MQTLKFDDRDTWMAARMGRVTGSRLKGLISKRAGKKIGFYELIAERIGLPPSDENPMDRGTRLEDEAIDRFESKTGEKVDRSLVLWTRDENSNIAVSPDGSIEGKNEAVECKCLSSARHIEALLTMQVPDEYEEQVLQYFIVNDALEKLHLCFYDPRLKVKDFFIITITRIEMLSKIEEVLIYEREILNEVDIIVDSLIKF